VALPHPIAISSVRPTGKNFSLLFVVSIALVPVYRGHGPTESVRPFSFEGPNRILRDSPQQAGKVRDFPPQGAGALMQLMAMGQRVARPGCSSMGFCDGTQRSSPVWRIIP